MSSLMPALPSRICIVTEKTNAESSLFSKFSGNNNTVRFSANGRTILFIGLVHSVTAPRIEVVCFVSIRNSTILFDVNLA